MRVRKVKWYTLELVRKNPDCLFVFGDNLHGVGKGGQAIIRDEPNSYGIPTKKAPSSTINSFFSDDELEENINQINSAISSIPTSFKCVVFPEDGLGTGLAELPQRAPKTYAHLISAINSKFGDIYE